LPDITFSNTGFTAVFLKTFSRPSLHISCHNFMNIILFDSDVRHQLLPFTHTRPVADLRCGILTMRKRWEVLLRTGSSSLTERYLQQAFPLLPNDLNVYINAAVFATTDLADAITQLNNEEALIQDNLLIAVKSNQAFSTPEELKAAAEKYSTIIYRSFFNSLNFVWDIFSQNGRAIAEDFALLTKGRQSQELPDYVTAIAREHIFVEPGAKIYPCIINAATGPVYIGKDAEIMEGCMIRGPFALNEHAVLKMGTKVYGPTTIGDGCKVGGELSNVVFFANSNKGHDGFLGNAVIGEWCNLGADTNCSNLKNNYDEVKIWNEYEQKSVKTGLQFCGLLMGDHSKCSINTMFNTGTVVGVSANIFGSGFPEKFVPSFSWGNGSEAITYKLEKAIDTANRMMARRNTSLSTGEIAVLKHIFDNSEKQRALIHADV